MTPAKVPSSLHRSADLASHRLLLAAVAVVASLLALPRLAPALAAAATGGASLQVLAVADTGSGNRHQMAVAQQMALVNRRQPVDLVLLAGDNVYPDGDPAQLDRLFVKPYQELLANKVPFFCGDRQSRHPHPQRRGSGGLSGFWYGGALVQLAAGSSGILHVGH